MRYLLFLNLLVFGFTASTAAPDTARIATYNILHYGQPGPNRYDVKNLYLQPILAEMKPSIIVFLEVDTFLNAAFDSINTNMPYPMQHGPVHNSKHTDILDGLFWKVNKFALTQNTVITNQVRDIVAYDLYYTDQQPGMLTDTVWLKVITAHLKSSNSVSDRNVRAQETQTVAQYLSNLPDSTNVVMMGDFNLYNSSEVAYQNLIAPTNNSGRLNDPLQMPGNWDGNQAFTTIHTQSPRTAQLSDWGAGGGLDSRFDFVLISDAMLNGWKGIQYIPGSYTAMGNDGQHFNKAIIDTPLSLNLPLNVVQALYFCADHLPVYADFSIHPKPYSGPTITSSIQNLNDQVRVSNPISKSGIHYQLNADLSEVSYEFCNMQGVILQRGMMSTKDQLLRLDADVPEGLYILKLSSTNASGIWKLVK